LISTVQEIYIIRNTLLSWSEGQPLLDCRVPWTSCLSC